MGSVVKRPRSPKYQCVAAVAWGLVEFAQEIMPRLGLPPAMLTYFIGIFVLGIPLTVLLSALFDITMKGIVRVPFTTQRFLLPLGLFAGILFAVAASLSWLMYVRSPAN